MSGSGHVTVGSCVAHDFECLSGGALVSMVTTIDHVHSPTCCVASFVMDGAKGRELDGFQFEPMQVAKCCCFSRQSNVFSYIRPCCYAIQ